MKKYKIDWLTFTVSVDDVGLVEEHIEKVLNLLGYSIYDFEKISGRYFYNSGITLGNFVNVYWNDPQEKIYSNRNDGFTVVFTGQGTTDLANKFNSDWQQILGLLKNYGRIKFSRIDCALDDFSETVKFVDIENKLAKGHYRSSKKSYNIVKTSDSKGRILGKTIYIGNARAQSGSRGNVFARFYDKKAQYESKNELFPTDVLDYWKKTGKQSWQRYEISFSKKYTDVIIDGIIAGEGIDKIFKKSLRNLLEILTLNKKDKNKSRWKKTIWWEKFLEYDETIDFGIAERDVMFGDLLEWLRVSILPTLALLEVIGKERGFDIYELLRQAEKIKGFSKKQNRLYQNSKNITEDDLNRYLIEFLKRGDNG